MVTRILSVLLALVLGAVAGFALCSWRDRASRAQLERASQELVREVAELRGERDRLATELAESARAISDLDAASEAMRRGLEDKLTRLEQLVAALVGTRPIVSPSGLPAVETTPGGGEVREPD